MRTTVKFEDIPKLFQKLGSSEAVEALCGQKATNLAKVAKGQIKIPDGFVITSDAYDEYSEKSKLTDELWSKIRNELKELEKRVSKNYGQKQPLFLSLSCTSPIPIIEGVGMNDFTASELSTKAQLRELPFALYPRLIQSIGSLVYGIDRDEFETLLNKFNDANGYQYENDFKPYDWVTLTKLFKALIVKKTGKLFPQDTEEQLRLCINAMFEAYTTSNVSVMREATQRPNKFSICVQEQIFGDFDIDSYSAVISTHNPATGAKETSGIFSAFSAIEEISNCYKTSGPGEKIDTAYKEADVKLQDIVSAVTKEFSVPMSLGIVSESNEVYLTSLLPTYTGNETPFNIVDVAISGGMGKSEAIKLIPAISGLHIGDQQLTVVPKEPLAEGAAGAFGVAIGQVVFSDDECVKRAAEGQNVVLVKSIITGLDTVAINAAVGVISLRGGEFSEGLRIVRALGKPAVFGLQDVTIDYEAKSLNCGSVTIKEGEDITIYGNAVFTGALPTSYKKPEGEAQKIIDFAKEIYGNGIKVYSEAEDVVEAQAAEAVESDGVGIIPIEKFWKKDASALVRIASSPEDETAAKELTSSLIRQLTDVLAACKNSEATIRLLEPSLTKFLPSKQELTREIAELRTRKEFEKGFSKQAELDKKVQLLEDVKRHSESNPLMGSRGIRLLLVIQPLLELQIRGICEAAKAAQRKGANPKLRILLPCVTEANEVKRAREIIEKIIRENELTAEIGAALEVPRACLTSKQISEFSDFIVVDVESLQQTLFGMAKEDAEHSFMRDYNNWGIVELSPFTAFDETAAGDIISKCVSGSGKPVGILGLNCMNESAISFFKKAGVTSFYCLPNYVPYVKLCIGKA